MLGVRNFIDKILRFFYQDESDVEEYYIPQITNSQTNQPTQVTKNTNCENIHTPGEMLMNHTYTAHDFQNIDPAPGLEEISYPTFGRNNYGLTGKKNQYVNITRTKHNIDRTREYFTAQCENSLYSPFPYRQNDLMIRDKKEY